MDKGTTRQTSLTKGVSENKTKPDNNKYVRYERYKDGTSPRPDTNRKPNPQKNRVVFDKRPRTRGAAAYEKYRNEVADSSIYCQKQGTKKVSLNHLLNFTLASTADREFCRGQSVRTRLKLPKYNKELFLQANCQFVIKDDSDYAKHCKNPDILVDWALIEEIRSPSYDVACCPICLHAPVAAKITRCGHIYCWSCMLHYLALTDRSWQKCPICFEAVHKTDLKSVLPITHKPVGVNDSMTMRLMKRDKDTMFPVPASFKTSVHACGVNDSEVVTRYQKLLLASKQDIYEIIGREYSELAALYDRERNEPEACFVETALKLLTERRHSLEAIDNMEVEDFKNRVAALSENYDGNQLPVLVGATCNCNDDCVETLYDDCDPSNSCNVISDSIHDLSLESSLDPHRKGKNTYYFYQAEDGQHIYLHSLNVRMLVKEYGSLEDSPLLITGNVIGMENISMNETLRKRMRYLQHMPLTREFQVAELKMTNGILSEDTIAEFAGEVSRRQKVRIQRAREERKREKFIQQEEEKKLGIYPSATYNLSSINQFPVCHSNGEIHNLSDILPSSDSQLASSYSDYNIQYPCVSSSSPIRNETPETPESSSPPLTSFAQMLREGQKNSIQKVANCSSPTTMTKQDEAPKSDDDYGAAPSYHQSFGDAFQVALDAVNSQNCHNSEPSTNRKKKKKNKILFTTSMCRSK